MADSTKLNKDGLNKVWLKVMELIQSLTGNVDRTKGTLQEQMDELNSNLANFFDHNKRTKSFVGDLNDITENGIVNCNADETQNKPPVSQWFFVLTMAHSYSADFITQVAFTMNCSHHEDSIWLRQKGSDTWGDWGKIGDAVKPLLSDRCIGYNLSFETLISSQTPTYFTNWHDSTNFPTLYGSGLLIPGLANDCKFLLYVANNNGYFGIKGSSGVVTWHEIASKTGDSKDDNVTFTSGDDTVANAWTDVAKLNSGEKHSSIFGKISTMFKNIRYLYNMLGTTDISSIGNGTVTGAIGTLNSNLMDNSTEFIKTWNTVNCADNYIIKIGNTVFFNVSVYNTSAVTADNYLLTFPEGYRPTDYLHFDVLNKSTKQYVGQTQIGSNGRCIFNFSIDANVYYAFIGFFIID